MSERVLQGEPSAFTLVAVPVYPSERELLRILFGQTLPPHHSEIMRQFERRGLPPRRAVLQRRYLPAVLEWCRLQETGGLEPLSRVRLRNAPDDGLERF